MVEDFVYSKAKELLNHQIKKSREFSITNTMVESTNSQPHRKITKFTKQLFKYVDLYPTLANNKSKENSYLNILRRNR